MLVKRAGVSTECNNQVEFVIKVTCRRHMQIASDMLVGIVAAANDNKLNI